MSLTKDELIDIRNALIFGKGFKQVLRQKPEYKKRGLKLDTYGTILLMCEEYPEFLGDGGTIKSESWLYKKLRYYRQKSNFKTTPMLVLDFDGRKWFIGVIKSYIYFVQDKEWMRDYHISDLKTLNTSKTNIEKIKKNYVQVVEGIFNLKRGSVPGGAKKYGKIIGGKN